MTLEQASIQLGKSENYFFTFRRTNPVLFRFSLMFGRGNVFFGYKVLQEYSNSLKIGVQDIAATWERDFWFAKWLCEIGVYATPHSALNINFIYHQDVFTNLKSLKKLKKIKKEFKNYENHSAI